MNIVQATYTTEDNTSLKVTLDDGTVWHMPQPCETWHNAYLQEYLDSGGVINPYVPPASGDELTVEEKLANAGITVDELKQALGL
jgi:hypothetical protein